METIRIIIADDHQIVRDGIKAMLEEYPQMEVCGEAENGEEVLSLCGSAEPDIILMDLNMPVMGGIETTKKIKEQYPDIEVLALTMVKNDQKMKEMIQNGASGYILKNSGVEELVEAIERVYEGKPYFNDETVYAMMKEMQEEREEIQGATGLESDLTDREIEILNLICQEYTNQEIGDKLYISVRTVDSHRRNLLQKTGARNTAGLVRYAMKHGLLSE